MVIPGGLSPSEPVLLRRVRLVPVTHAAPSEPVDVRIRDGQVADIGPSLSLEREPEREIDGDGRWLIPGLWDQHVHFLQWAQLLTRLDTTGSASAAEVLDRLRHHLAVRDDSVIVGWGHRLAHWPDVPTVAALDAVCGERAVVLISGDAHHAWLSSAAFGLLEIPRRAGVVEEAEWFAAYARLGALPEMARQAEDAVAVAVDAAARAGVVGVVDLEFGAAFRDWPERVARGITSLRVRTGTYPDRLADVVAAGVRTGDDLVGAVGAVPPPPGGLVTMGPLKVIFDGSLSTHTAYCCDPYLSYSAGAGQRGRLNITTDELVDMMASAQAAGLDMAVHAIGDAAVGSALDCFARTGSQGSIEHAQLMQLTDVARLAQLGLTASVQPAHVLDDRDIADRWWGDRTDRCYPFRALADGGVRITFGSDAPVAPLDPWLAMAAAVHRSGDHREPWHPEQSLGVAEALAASTDGKGTVERGMVADLALVDHDPQPETDPATAADRLRAMTVSATLLGGRVTHCLI